MPVIPPPPPTGHAVQPTDDWTEDPSFDLSLNDAFSAASSSPSSVSSRASRPSFGRAGNAGSSPLRQTMTRPSVSQLAGPSQPPSRLPKLSLKGQVNVGAIGGDGDDDFDLDFDIPDDAFGGSTIKGNAQQYPRSSTPKPTPKQLSVTPSSSVKSLSATVVGKGPSGVGTITRLGSKTTTPTKLPISTMRARAKAIEKAWEADMDFGAVDDSKARKLVLSPPKKVSMPDASALDELGFDLDDEDQATLKATATIKAMLPPQRREGSGTIKPTKFKLKTPQPVDDDDLEGDLVLPLNMTNLTLASGSQPRSVKPRTSMASLMTEGWESPSTSSSARKSTAGAFSWGDDSPVTRRTRTSETSSTSISDAPPYDPAKHKAQLREDGDIEEEDYEDGLVLPDPSFFSTRRANVLNSILDRKRRQEYAPRPRPERKHPTSYTGDDSFEDGLLFDNPRAELSHRRLEKSRRARTTVPVPFNFGSVRKGARSSPTVEKDVRNAFTRSTAPVVNRGTTGTGASTGLGLTGMRSHSTSTQSGTQAPIHHRRPESPLVLTREHVRVEQERAPPRQPSRPRLASGNMLPPPVPSVPPVPPALPPPVRTELSTPRLRHQKSHHHLAPSPSPTLTRKQSLASLQDAIAAGQAQPPTTAGDEPPEVPPLYDPLPSVRHQSYSNYSTSRLTMPTSSSLAKIRQPVHTIFPRAGEGSSRSIRNPRQMEMPRRTKQWGDGTELEGIEDLRVEDDPRTTAGHQKLGRKVDNRSQTLPSPSVHKPSNSSEPEKRKKSGTKRPRQRKQAMLIRNLGAVDKPKVVGEMTWNPKTLRWEGNESILGDFDAVASSVRPALITHLTGSSGVPAMAGSGLVTHAQGLPRDGGLNSASAVAPAATVRIVGDMKFDPEKMCWVSLLPPDESEPDPFADMADDEDDSFSTTGATGGATVTRTAGRKLVTIGLSNASTAGATGGSSFNSNGRFVSDTAQSVNTVGTSTSISSSLAAWEEHTRPQLGTEIPTDLWEECVAAEERHRRDMRGWSLRSASSAADLRDRDRREEKRLWEVRNLAIKLG